MLLKNMLEYKKLNLSQPILSVRKYSPIKFNGRKIENGLPIIPTRLPPSVPVKIAGAVPFQWEETPGKPKENSDTPPNYEANYHNIQTEESKSFQSDDCDDEAFVDALERLSRIESLFLLNSRTGKLMMDRFLPAPKSMHTDKKQSPVGQQQRRKKMKIVYGNNPGLQYGHSSAKRYIEKEESDQHGYLRPRFCLNTSSVYLINPAPAKKEYDVKSNDKIQAAETKENKGRWKKNEKAVLCVPEETKHAGSNRKTFQELLADQGSPKLLDSGGSVVHNTSNKLKNTRPFSPNTQRMEQMHVVDSTLHEAFKNLNTADAKLLPNAHINSRDFNINVSPSTCGKWGMEMPKDFAENQHSKETENIQGAEKETTKKQLPRRSITLGNSGKKYSGFLVPPPLLKSPQDSWLCRTLPSIMSTKNASRYSYLKSSKPGPL